MQCLATRDYSCTVLRILQELQCYHSLGAILERILCCLLKRHARWAPSNMKDNHLEERMVIP